MFDMKPAITPEVSLEEENMVEMKISGRYTHNQTSSERTQAHKEPTIVRMAPLRWSCATHACFSVCMFYFGVLMACYMPAAHQGEWM